MRALLLAAGLGTRLRPLTNKVPKCMVPIHGKPLLGYWLDTLLTSRDIERIIINTHHLPNSVRDYIFSSKWEDKIDLVHEECLLGTGGTIVNISSFLNDEAFMVGHADNLTRFNVNDFIQSHKERPKSCVMTMMTFETDQPKNCGIVELNERGIVLKFHEKVKSPPGNLANGAVYIFEPEIIDYLLALDKPIIDLSTEVLPNFLGRINTFLNSEYHRDIGNIDSLRTAELDFSVE